MSLSGSPQPDQHWFDRMTTLLAHARNVRVDRRALGGSGIAAVIGAAIIAPIRGTVQAIQPSAIKDVLADAATLEGLMVTLLGVARTKSTELALDESTVRLLRAAQCEEEAHFNNLTTRGGSPTIGTYTIADELVANAPTFLSTWAELERILVGLYMVGVRQSAASGDEDLVELLYQIGTVESQHLALLRQILGERLPADRAFAPWQFRTSTEAVASVQAMGLIGGSGTSYDYPGPGERYCRGVTGLVAELTSDQTEPDVTAAPPVESPPTAATPEGSPVDNA